MTGLPLDGLSDESMPAHTVIVPAPAKVNPFLRVLGRRDDGFHDLETVVLPIALGDRLQVHAYADSASFRTLSLSLETTGEDERLVAGVPLDESNLVLRAAHALARQGDVRGFAEFVLEKRVPVAAGLGGGSADAAAALRALNELWGLVLAGDELRALGETIGSDLPALLLDGPCVARGRGERVETVGGVRAGVVIVPFSFGVSTADAYGWWDEDGSVTGPDPSALLSSLDERAGGPDADRLATLEGALHNDLEAPVARRHPAVRDAREVLAAAGVSGVVMTGSGPTVVGFRAPGSPPLDAESERALERIAGRPVVYTETRAG